MASSRTRRTRGMTLVEILIAMVILSIGLLAMISVISAAQQSADKSNYDMIALQAAENEIADDEAGGYSANTYGTTVTPVPNLPHGQMTVVTGPLDGDAANDNIVQIDVTVTWDGGSGPNSTGGNISMSTLISAVVGG